MAEVHIKRIYSIPAAIQFMNPGAMWPGATATKWGSTKWQYLSDGTGQGGGGHGNKIAIFDNWVDGIAAQLDLWRSSPNYKNKRFADAIRTWSGGNNVGSYIAHVKARIPEMDENTIMNDAFWRSPNGMKFLKVQASHEAGKPIPATDDQYAEAQRRVFKVVAAQTTKKSAGAAVGGGSAAAAAHQAGFSPLVALAIGVTVAVVIVVVWHFKHKSDAAKAAAEQPTIITPTDDAGSEQPK